MCKYCTVGVYHVETDVVQHMLERNTLVPTGDVLVGYSNVAYEASFYGSLNSVIR